MITAIYSSPDMVSLYGLTIQMGRKGTPILECAFSYWGWRRCSGEGEFRVPDRYIEGLVFLFTPLTCTRYLYTSCSSDGWSEYYMHALDLLTKCSAAGASTSPCSLVVASNCHLLSISRSAPSQSSLDPPLKSLF